MNLAKTAVIIVSAAATITVIGVTTYIFIKKTLRSLEDELSKLDIPKKNQLEALSRQEKNDIGVLPTENLEQKITQKESSIPNKINFETSQSNETTITGEGIPEKKDVNLQENSNWEKELPPPKFPSRRLKLTSLSQSATTRKFISLKSLNSDFSLSGSIARAYLLQNTLRVQHTFSPEELNFLEKVHLNSEQLKENLLLFECMYPGVTIVDKKTFLDQMGEFTNNKNNEELWSAFFDWMDINGKGEVNAQGFAIGWRILMDGTSQQKLALIFEKWDNNKDGVVSLEEIKLGIYNIYDTLEKLTRDYSSEGIESPILDHRSLIEDETKEVISILEKESEGHVTLDVWLKNLYNLKWLIDLIDAIM